MSLDAGGEPVVVAAARAVHLRGGPDAHVWARCAGGLEREAATELAALGWRPPPTTTPRPPDQPGGTTAGLEWERGAVYGTVDLATLRMTLRAARTVTRVVLLLGTAEVDEVTEIREAVRSLDWDRLPYATFGVRPERHGEHGFRSPDIGREAGAGIIDAFRERTGQRLPVDLDDPTVEIRAELHDRRLRVGYDLAGRSLHRRTWIRAHHHASLKPTVAAGLVALARWRVDERLLDPLAGGGTIPIEAALAALRRPVGPRVLPRLAPLDLDDTRIAVEVEERLEAARVSVDTGARPLDIRGVEKYGRHVADAQRNLAAADLAGVVRIAGGDATTLDDIEAVDCAIANPPYGMRVASPKVIDPLYRGTIARLAERFTDAGRAVWLTPVHHLVRAAGREAGLEAVAARRVGLGTMDAVAFVLAPPGRVSTFVEVAD
ncbi:hypothetical protein ER308_09205 [Egibacter rhizosphaerae]|uniref:THUMP domain-containing protein n=1 Tax=Egibacter rhizosphaerae TaxID=1670831 RepID=A0A411YES9_9ACTN|nr:THUMP domain-containing protein [Egibacter rhizosphaerae]QBI19706.1 hypothetical protein ER308_09205 [Egibacter rhizosphaerae]